MAQPLRSVQNGDFESFRTALPPRDYFTDEIRRQLTEDFGEGEFFTGGFTVRATIDQEMQVEAALALRTGPGEIRPKSRGQWRGTGVVLPEEQLKDEPSLARGTGKRRCSRDIVLGGSWYPAVVLEVAAIKPDRWRRGHSPAPARCRAPTSNG